MTPTLVLVDAGMVAGFRRSSLSLGQLHQALVHLARQHPEAQVAVVADPSLKWDLAPADQPCSRATSSPRRSCAPRPAPSTARSASSSGPPQRATNAGQRVVAFTDRALPGVSLGRLRNEGGKWVWDLDDVRTIEADAAATASAQPRRRTRSRR